MSRKKRIEKVGVENRKLKKENDNLKYINKNLTEKLLEVQRKEERNRAFYSKMWVYNYIYDVIIASIVLIAVYWFAMNRTERPAIPCTCIMILPFCVSLKYILCERIIKFDRLGKLILNDLVKPFLSMVLGFGVCIICLGEEWRNAKGYAHDVVNMGVIIGFVIVAIVFIFLASYLLVWLWDKVKRYLKGRIRVNSKSKRR